MLKLKGGEFVTVFRKAVNLAGLRTVVRVHWHHLVAECLFPSVRRKQNLRNVKEGTEFVEGFCVSGASTQFYLMSLSSSSLGDINVHIFPIRKLGLRKVKLRTCWLCRSRWLNCQS